VKEKLTEGIINYKTSPYKRKGGREKERRGAFKKGEGVHKVCYTGSNNKPTRSLRARQKERGRGSTPEKHCKYKKRRLKMRWPNSTTIKDHSTARLIV